MVDLDNLLLGPKMCYHKTIRHFEIIHFSALGEYVCAGCGVFQLCVCVMVVLLTSRSFSNYRFIFSYNLILINHCCFL